MDFSSGFGGSALGGYGPASSTFQMASTSHAALNNRNTQQTVAKINTLQAKRKKKCQRVAAGQKWED